MAGAGDIAQGSLMNYAAEARPYMPLAAAVIGTLALDPSHPKSGEAGSSSPA